jgi:hypothetical protein
VVKGPFVPIALACLAFAVAGAALIAAGFAAVAATRPDNCSDADVVGRCSPSTLLRASPSMLFAIAAIALVTSALLAGRAVNRRAANRQSSIDQL